jgi:hypothetical protein
VKTPITERTVNNAPVIERITLTPSRPRPGEGIAVSVAAADPDGDQITLSYEWRVDGNRIPNTSSSLNVESVRKNSLIEVAVVASDGVDQSPAERATARVGNQAPQVLQVVIEPLGVVTVEHDVTASPKANDPDGDDLDYRYTWTVNGDEVSEDGPVLSREHYKRGDQIEISVIAMDGQDQSDPLSSDAIEVSNARPAITSEPGAFDGDGVFRYQVTAEDPDNDRMFRYRLLEGPTGMNLDIVSGLMQWVPADDQAGSHPVKLEIDDRKGGVASQTFKVDVEFEEESVPAAQAD